MPYSYAKYKDNYPATHMESKCQKIYGTHITVPTVFQWHKTAARSRRFTVDRI